MTKATDQNMQRELLENEWFTVRYSGETPEIALHSALYYLTEDSEGPGLVLAVDEINVLRQAAADRYLEIILRDLEPANRVLPIYRGVKRSIINYHRYQSFCRRQQLDGGKIIAEVAAALLLFLAREMVAAAKEQGCPAVNCSFVELNVFAQQLGLVQETLPPAIALLCEQPAVDFAVTGKGESLAGACS